MPENKVTFGLKKVHYALYTITDGVITYETPIPIPGAVELSGEPRGDMVEFFADDMLYYAASNNQGYENTLSIANIPDQFAQDALGEELDETDFVLNELANKSGKPFALLFEFDGDVKATRHIMYNCLANRPTVSSSSKTDTVEPNANELSLIASPIKIGDKLMVKTKTTIQTPSAVYDSWYSTVYKKTPTV